MRSGSHTSSRSRSPAARWRDASSLAASGRTSARQRRIAVSTSRAGPSATTRGSRLAGLQIAGKTATAQNPHGPDHGWFIGFAPAEKPEIVVGAIIEFSQHGSAIAPLVSRVIAHYLGIDETRARQMRVVVPADSAPAPFALPGATPDTVLAPPIPTDSVIPRPPTR